MDRYTQKALDIISSHRTRFQHFKAGFVAPDVVDFTMSGETICVDARSVAIRMAEDLPPPLPADANGCLLTEPPKLAFTTRNKPLHAYLDGLNQLLGGLDAVESGGDISVREQRGAAIREVDSEAQWVEAWTRRVWREQARRNAHNSAAEERANAALHAIVAVDADFENLKAAFSLPEELDFVVDGQNITADARTVSPPPLSDVQEEYSASIPSLAYTPTNVPMHKLMEGVTNLLIRLDGTPGGIDTEVKARRTLLIHALEMNARQTESWIRSVWLAYLRANEDATQDAETSAERVQQLFYSLGALDGRFRQLKASFTMPLRLDFTVEGKPVSVDSSAVLMLAGEESIDDYLHLATVPPLAFTPTNVALHRHYQDLDRILSECDSIESSGEIMVRERRMELVRAIQTEAQKLDRWVRSVWATQREDPNGPTTAQSDDSRPLRLSLEELFLGTAKVVKYTRNLHVGGLVDQELSITILPGYKVGTKIRFPRAGSELRAGQPQDLVFIVEELLHPRFIREGNNLITRLPLSEPSSRSNDQRHMVETLDGRYIAVSPPSGSLRKGSVTVLAGEGMPVRRHGASKGRGDLIVQWDVGDLPPPLPPKPLSMSSPPVVESPPRGPFQSPFGRAHSSPWQHEMPTPFAQSQMPSTHTNMPFAQGQTPFTWSGMRSPHAHNPFTDHRFSMPYPGLNANNMHAGPRSVRRGFWNNKGDHLTDDGYVVYAPEHLAYPPDLHKHPPPARGFMNHNSDFQWYNPNQRVHPETISWHNQPPRRPYTSFIEWCDASILGFGFS